MNEQITIRKALKVWDRLGDIAVTEEGDQLDMPFVFMFNGTKYKYNKGDSLNDLWHDLEEIYYPFSVGYAANGLYDKNGNELEERDW